MSETVENNGGWMAMQCNTIRWLAAGDSPLTNEEMAFLTAGRPPHPSLWPPSLRAKLRHFSGWEAESER